MPISKGESVVTKYTASLGTIIDAVVVLYVMGILLKEGTYYM